MLRGFSCPCTLLPVVHVVIVISFFKLSAPEFTPTSTLPPSTEYADGERWSRRERANRKDHRREKYRFVCNARRFEGCGTNGIRYTLFNESGGLVLGLVHGN